MMYCNKLKRYVAILLAGTMAFSLAGCGSKNTDDQEETTTEATVAETATEEGSVVETPDYVDGDVVLPENFDNMIYPLTSLLVESASKGLAYYTEDSGEEEADSFWFSMAVLTSLTNTYVREVDEDTEDSSMIYVTEDTAYMFASALYDAFAQGELGFPVLSDDNTYAVYAEDEEMYGFVSGNIGTMEAYITGCEENGEKYLLTMELRDSEKDEIYGTYEIEITETSFEDEDNLFMYAVTSFTVVSENEDAEGEYAVTTETGDESDVSTAEEETEDETDVETDEEVESADTATESEEGEGSDGTSTHTTSGISQSEALALAKEYYGDDAEYTFEGMVTIGDYEYYNFAVDGDTVSSTDVLVSTTGNDVMGGVQNDDGSWSFDQ